MKGSGTKDGQMNRQVGVDSGFRIQDTKGWWIVGWMDDIYIYGCMDS